MTVDGPPVPEPSTARAHRIVDAHVHVWQQPYPDGPMPWREPHPVAALLATLDAAGVEAAVQVTPSPEGWDNRYGLEAVRAHPERLSAFGRIDPAAPDPEARLRAWLREPGATGVRLTFFGAGAAAGGGLLALEDFWAACERLAVPVSLFAPDNLPEAVRVLERHPDLRLIVDHLGLGVYPGCEDPLKGLSVLAEFEPFATVRVKVSGLVEVSGEGFPFRDVHEHLEAALRTFGSERLIWGSNHPVVAHKCSYAESLEYLYECEFLSDLDLRHLLGDTVEEMLGGWPPA
jgi:predicted TIM-barrel fold metal-dependent hydrolase